MPKIIVHIDMNSYFASCATLLYPQYKNKPLAVGGKGNKGIISTANYEARKYGVNSAMPTYLALKKCPNLIIVDPSFELYEYYTKEFIKIIKRYTNKIELASIDECYADLTDSLKDEKDPLSKIKEIQDKIYGELGLPCSIGVSYNKFLAQMASDMKKPMGITVIRKSDIKEKLWPLPGSDIFGIGKKSVPKFLNNGINTIKDLVDPKNEELVRKLLGRFYNEYIDLLNGVGTSEINNSYYQERSLGHSSTFAENSNDFDVLLNYLKNLCEEVSLRAKHKHLLGDSIQLTIRSSNFETIVRSIKMNKTTNKSDDLYLYAKKLLYANYDGSYMIRLLGVTLKNLIKENDFYNQLNLFELDETESFSNTKEIKKIVSDINRILGTNKLKIASEDLK